MRALILLLLFAASLAWGAWNDYQEQRELTLSASGINELSVDAGAGLLVIDGDPAARDIRVVATAVVDGVDDDEAAGIITDELVLELTRDGDRAELVAALDYGGWNAGGRVDLEISAPPGITLRIDDGSGNTDIRGMQGDVFVDDGSGSLSIDGGARITIDDGSGSIEVANASADVAINDGSGSIDVRHVTGTVTIDDGSGSIEVDDVGVDLVIIDDGSGSFDYANVRGRVEYHD